MEKHKKCFYGFRYFSGFSTREGNTDRIAGNGYIFDSKEEIQDWLDDQRLCSYFVDGGGRRKQVSRKDLISMIGTREFNELLETHHDEEC